MTWLGEDGSLSYLVQLEHKLPTDALIEQKEHDDETKERLLRWPTTTVRSSVHCLTNGAFSVTTYGDDALKAITTSIRNFTYPCSSLTIRTLATSGTVASEGDVPTDNESEIRKILVHQPLNRDHHRSPVVRRRRTRSVRWNRHDKLR